MAEPTYEELIAENERLRALAVRLLASLDKESGGDIISDGIAKIHADDRRFIENLEVSPEFEVPFSE